MRRWLALCAALATAGCGSQLQRDLRAADARCDEGKAAGKAAFVACLDAQDRPVWAHEEPATLDLYDGFARRRAALARQLDQGTIDDAHYRAELASTVKDFKGQVAARRAAAAAQE